jgi:PleD family two-component response regulator
VGQASDWLEQGQQGVGYKDEETIEMGAVTGRLRALSKNMQLRILIVDDDDLARILIADRLEARGFEVARAANGAEALACSTSSLFLYCWLIGRCRS